MKRIVCALVFICFSTVAAADDTVPCDVNGFRGTVKIAADNGYTWPGTFNTAKCELTTVAAFVWSGPATSNAMLAVTRANPYRVQFYRGGTLPLFCVKLVNNTWSNVGKTCDG